MASPDKELTIAFCKALNAATRGQGIALTFFTKARSDEWRRLYYGVASGVANPTPIQLDQIVGYCIDSVQRHGLMGAAYCVVQKDKLGSFIYEIFI